ncbi:MAG: flippase [Patescibacteria group bacterium]
MGKASAYLYDLIHASRSRVSRDTVIMFIGNFVNALLVFGFSVLVSRNMSVENFGIYSFATAILVVVVELSDSGLTTTVIRFASQHLTEGRERLAKAIFYVSLRYRVLSSALLCTAGFLLSNWVVDFIFNKPAVAAPFRLALIAVFLINIQNFISSVLLSYRRFAIKVSYNIFISAMKILLLLGFVYVLRHELTPNPAVSILVIATVFGLMFGAFIVPSFPIRRPVNIEEYRAVQRETFHFSKWITVSLAASMIFMRLDTFFLTRMTTLDDVGLYNAAMNFANFFNISSTAVTSTFLPHLSRYTGERLKRFYATILKFFPLVVVSIIILVFFSPFLINLMFGHRYENASPILRVLFIASGMNMLVNPLIVVLYRLKRVRAIAFMNITQLLFCIGLNLIFIPSFGSIGAAWTKVALNILAIAWVMIVSQRYFSKIVPEAITEEPPVDPVE